MAIALLSPSAKQQFFFNSGAPAVGGKLFTYLANSTTPAQTFTNRAGTVANTNPIILDARGEAILYLTPGVVYDYVLKDANDVQVWLREDVAADSGDANAVAFLQKGAGATPRSVQDKLRDIANVKDFGAVWDGASHPLSERYSTLTLAQADYPHATALTDEIDWAASQAAVNNAQLSADGGRVEFPDGLGRFNRTLTVTGNGIKLVGRGPNSSRISMSVQGIPIIRVTGNAFGLNGLYLTYSGTLPTTAASTAIIISGERPTLDDFQIQFTGSGVKLENSYSAWLSNFVIWEFSQAGVYFSKWIDAFVDQFTTQSGVGLSRGQMAGIYIDGMSDAVVVSNGDLLSGRHGIRCAEATQYSLFNNLYLDSSYEEPLLCDGGLLVKFTNCWFSGGRSGAGFSGVQVRNSNGIDFVNCIMANSGLHGAFVQSTAKHVAFNTCAVYGNCRTAAGHGIVFANNTSDFKVLGCSIRNSLVGLHGYGIVIGGTSDNFIVADNNLLENSTGGMIDSSTGSAKQIHGNLGYTKPYTAPAFLGTWVDFGGSAQTAGYLKDSNGFVHLKGTIKSGTINTPAFNLPAGFRPSGEEYFAAWTNGAFGALRIQANGDVVPESGSPANFSLGGVSFLGT